MARLGQPIHVEAELGQSIPPDCVDYDYDDGSDRLNNVDSAAATPAEADEIISATDELKAFDQWVAWKYVFRGKAEKPTKLPVNPHTGEVVVDAALPGLLERSPI